MLPPTVGARPKRANNFNVTDNEVTFQIGQQVFKFRKGNRPLWLRSILVLKGIIVKSFRANGMYRQSRKIFTNDCEYVGGIRFGTPRQTLALCKKNSFG
jgi:hypothetical protein